MGTSDDEFEHYLKELNDIVDFSHGLSRLNYLSLPRSIHEVYRFAVMDSWVAFQSRLKYILGLYRGNVITQPIFCIHLSPSDLIHSHHV